jgi:hypothetical protein
VVANLVRRNPPGIFQIHPENPMSQLYVSLQFLEPLVSIIFIWEGGFMGYLTYLFWLPLGYSFFSLPGF